MSDDDKTDVLNLDELFGQARPMKVLWGKGEYLLLHPEAFGPRQIVRISALRRKVNDLLRLEDMDQAQEKELVEILDELLTILCKDMPVAEMEFSSKLRVMNFYTQETEKNVLKALLRRIGATPPAS